jgi:long-subunit acyl-CoA synthetase (AMP-forming)
MRNSILAAVRRAATASIEATSGCALQPALDDGVRKIGCADLNQLVEHERRWLSSFGVRDCALVAENSCGWVVSDLALMACGAANATIPVSFTAEQVSYAVHDSGVEFVLTAARLRSSAEHAGFTKVGLSDRTGLTLMHRRRACLRQKIPPGILKVSYRAQGMSPPGAVMLSAVMIERAAEQLLQVHTARGITRHLAFLPLSSVLENIGGLYVPLLLGAEVLLKTRAVAAMSCAPTGVETLLEVLRQERPHSVALTAEVLGAVVNAAERGWRAPAELASVVLDRESVSAELLQRARAQGLPITEWDPLDRATSHERPAEAPIAVAFPPHAFSLQSRADLSAF